MTSSIQIQKRIKRLIFFRLAFFSIIFTSLIASLFIIKGLFITLLLAFVLSFILNPPVNFLSRWIPRNYATPLVFISFLGGLSFLLYRSLPLLSEQFNKLQTEFPNYIEQFSILLNNWQNHLENNFFFLKNLNLSTKLIEFLSSFGETFLQELPSTLTQSFTILLLAPFFAFYITKSRLGLIRNFYPLVPNQVFEMFLTLHHKINKQIGVFVRGRILEACIVGTIIGVGLLILNFPFAILLGIFASFTNLIPYLGPIIGSLPVLLVALVNDYEISQILIVMGLFFFTQVIDSMVLVPILLARIVNLHPLTVIIIIIAGAQFMGIIGMIISIPLVNALKVSITAIYQHISDNIY
ncbi:MAG: AI-2E family transporter [Bdellovibrionales bacterium]|nr:AI-2E family transporter [Bdellovibrionales bacterium]